MIASPAGRDTFFPGSGIRPKYTVPNRRPARGPGDRGHELWGDLPRLHHLTLMDRDVLVAVQPKQLGQEHPKGALLASPLVVDRNR